MNDDDDFAAAAERTVRDALAALGQAVELMACDPDLADTVVFCQRYGYVPEQCANTIVVKAKTGGERYVACVLLAHTRLDVNKVIRKRLQARRVSFASALETRDQTGMVPGGVTPPGLPPDLAVWVDARVMACERIVLGGGSRALKLVTTPALLLVLPAVEVIEDLALPPLAGDAPG